MTTSSDVHTIAEAMAVILQGVPGLNAFSRLPDNFPVPCAAVAIDKVGFHKAFRDGDAVHEFIVHLIVGRVSDIAGTEQMDAFMSQANSNDLSIQGALEADQTVGGTAGGIVVTDCGPPVGITIGQSGATYIDVQFQVTVHA